MAEGFKVLVFVAGVGVRGNHNPSRPARRWREREREGARERERERESERARERWGGKGGKGGAGGGGRAGAGALVSDCRDRNYRDSQRTKLVQNTYRMCSL
jgi:hypothetical protein